MARVDVEEALLCLFMCRDGRGEVCCLSAAAVTLLPVGRTTTTSDAAIKMIRQR